MFTAPVALPASEQVGGDPEAGYRYLVEGDYIGSGYPETIYPLLALSDPDPQPATLGRAGAERIPDTLNRWTMPSGVTVVAGANCLACHAQRFRGEFVVGMGNSLANWTAKAPPGIEVMGPAAKLAFGEDSPEYEAFWQYFRGVLAIAHNVRAPFRGVVPAYRLEEVSAAHRTPEDLAWREDGSLSYAFAPEVYASDPPPLWHVKKKHTLYYNGMGRGDFAKLIQQIGMVAMGDAHDAERVSESMPDLIAYLRTLEPPAYPGEIDAELALQGAELFAANCTTCHGTYDSSATLEREPEAYPNLLVPYAVVGTDRAYADMIIGSGLSAWFNDSWYASTEPRAEARPAAGYVAPPLDGVWATAPYLHNGSVPTLDTLLDSSKRPARWTRTFDQHDYDLESPGWRYAEPEEGDPRSLNTYDTGLPGYGNGGHTFGDRLTDAERLALIEYLKTL
ncbi:MAG: hypothetical protein AAF108_05155 [Planctomycetota bacterium]